MGRVGPRRDLRRCPSIAAPNLLPLRAGRAPADRRRRRPPRRPRHRPGINHGPGGPRPRPNRRTVRHRPRARRRRAAPPAPAPRPRDAAVSDERLRRWRLVLGGDAGGGYSQLGGADAARDAALNALYGQAAPTVGRGNTAQPGKRRAGLGGSAPSVARWLGDIRKYFPTSVVRVMQSDAMDRLGLRQLLLEPELLDAVEPDVSLVATLIS